MPNANPVPVRPRRMTHFSDGFFVAAALMAAALIGLVALGARTWIDRPFAGLFLRADRTVAAVGRTTWPGVASARLYERTMVAVDGIPLADSDALQRRITAKPVGSPMTYTLTDGTTTESVTIASRRFSASDYWSVFGASLAAGLFYILLAILAAWALPSLRLGRALLYLGGAGGLYMLSATDLYTPAGSLRVHALAATLLPATLLQFALAIGDTRTRFETLVLPLVWAVTLAAAVSMQILIGDPAATSWVRATCDATLGLAFLTAAVGLGATRRSSSVDTEPLIATAALFGLAVPAVIFLVSGTLGGVPINAGAALACLFPVAMSVAVLRGDPILFAVDARHLPTLGVAPARRSL